MRQSEQGALRTTCLLAGDLSVFVVFAALGRDQHHESQGIGAIVATAWPFIAAWLLVTTLRRVAPGKATSNADGGRSVLLTWLIAWPIALAMRAAFQHRGIPIGFDIVALLFNALLLVGWRMAAAMTTAWVVRQSSMS